MNHDTDAIKEELFRRAEAFCEAHGITLSVLAHRVMKDSKFFRRVEQGGGFTIETLGKFYRHFDEHPAKEKAG